MVAGLCVLLVFIGSAMGALWEYKNTPGAQAEAPLQWPAGSGLERATDRPTLVLLAHPMCPCTRASMSELRTLMSEFEGRVAAHVLFELPSGAGEDWKTSGAWATAAAIPGVRVRADTGARATALFGAKTSGHVVLYGQDGQLLFHGGITGARGHVGRNEGRARLTELLRGHATAPAGAPVFGCALEAPEEAP
ncbi:MAG: RedB protein [Archangium sp.]|nr:RedB protein [Archangium sp.]